MRMVDPKSVIEPVVAVVLLEHFVVRDLQKPNVLLIYALVPDVVQDGHLLEVWASGEVWQWRCGNRRQAVQQQRFPASPRPPRRFHSHRRFILKGQKAIFCRQDRLRFCLSFPEVQAWVVRRLNGRRLWRQISEMCVIRQRGGLRRARQRLIGSRWDLFGFCSSRFLLWCCRVWWHRNIYSETSSEIFRGAGRMASAWWQGLVRHGVNGRLFKNRSIIQALRGYFSVKNQCCGVREDRGES